MDLFVDNHLVDSAEFCGSTVEETVRSIQARLCAPGRLVVGLRFDGQEVGQEEMNGALARPMADVKRLDVTTLDRAVLIEDAMNHAATSLEKTVEASAEAAEMLTTGQMAQGIEALGGCTRAWQQIHLAVIQSLSLLGVDPGSLTVEGERLVDVIEKPREALNQIKQALMAQDQVLLADILRYEFEDAVRAWEAVIRCVGRLGREEAKLAE